MGEGAVSEEWVAPSTDDIIREEREWLWEPWIPKASIGMIAGDPGAGKSTVILDLIARMTRGDVMPNGTHLVKPIRCLILPLEADLGVDIAPRLDLMGADGKYLNYLPRRFHPTFPRDLPKLSKIISDLGSEFVMIDPMFKAINAAESMNENQRTAQIMQAFEDVVLQTRAALVFIHHLNKGMGAKALYRAAGAISIAGSIRFSYAVAPVPNEEDLRAFCWYKANVNNPKMCPTMTFELTQSIDNPYLTLLGWRGSRPEITAQTLFEGIDQVARRARRSAAPEDRCAMWMREYFDRHGVGPHDPQAVYAAGLEEGFSKDEVSRARRSAGIELQPVHPSGAMFWSRRPTHH